LLFVRHWLDHVTKMLHGCCILVLVYFCFQAEDGIRDSET